MIKQIGLGLVHKLYEGDNVGILHMKSSEFKMSVRRQTNTEPVFGDLFGFTIFQLLKQNYMNILY